MVGINVYHVAHVCCCDECKGKLWAHSQGAWDGHIKYVAPELVVDISPECLSKDQEKLRRQVKAIARRRRQWLRRRGLSWRRFPNGYTYVGTPEELKAIKETFK